MKKRTSRSPEDQYATFGHSRGVRLTHCDYAGSVIVHATVCANQGSPFVDQAVARMVCGNVEYYCEKLKFRLYGYSVMPDHLHVLFSPDDSGNTVVHWMDSFKSYTTNRFMKMGGHPPLWQRSWHDHVCRESETAETVLTYIANNSVRAGLVENWTDWTWTRVFVEI